MRGTIFALLCIILSPSVIADIDDASSDCSTGIAESTPSSDFTAVGDGSIVRHETTGLEWQRCMVGQTWDDSAGECEGPGDSMSWDEALALGDSEAGWRLPNIKELYSIMEDCTEQPVVNGNVFPAWPGVHDVGGWVWSSSPKADNSSQVWLGNFREGLTSTGNRGTGSSAAFLVRPAETYDD